MQKRILSFILCAVLICGLFPTTATAMGSQAEYTGVCTHGSHEGYIELTSEYLATHNDRLSSGKYYLSGDLNYSGSYYLDVASNANVELCLNGHTLTFSNQYLLVLDDASLLLENGKVMGCACDAVGKRRRSDPRQRQQSDAEGQRHKSAGRSDPASFL